MVLDSDVAFLADLESEAEVLLERHLAAHKEWHPHTLVPWSRGRDFEPGEEWDPDEFPLSEAVRSSLYVNLLTEDNLPHYFQTIRDLFRGDAWTEWAGRWVAEEGRHSQVIRDWLLITRAIDPRALETARMLQVQTGEVPRPDLVIDGLVYVALQELATRLAHRNTGLLIDDPAGQQIMKRVATDENFHHLFYRDLCAAAMELDPSGFVLALERQVVEFNMPGTGIPEFTKHARVIAAAGIYDFEQHVEKILDPVIGSQWGIDDLADLSDDAKESRDRLHAHIARLRKAGVAQRRRRERDRERSLVAAAAAADT